MEPMIEWSITESVATITLGRPKAKNAIGTRMSAELKDIRNEVGRNKTVRVVVITGAEPDVFCMGTDQEEFSSFKDAAERIALFSVASIVESFTSR